MQGGNLRDRVIVITGASAGVGRATARACAERGARVGLLARGEDGLRGAAADVVARGGRPLAISTDVADAEAVERAARMIEDELGPIDIWINNAMVSVLSPVREMEAREYRRVTEVTYLGVVHGTLSALRRMRARRRGVIVQVGSALAYRGIPLQSAYCAAKHAVQGFTESLRAELRHERIPIHVTSVHLPALNTPQFRWVMSRLPRRPQPVPPIYQPEVAAEAILWAATHRRREVHVGFPTVGTIWGNRLAPAVIERYLGATGYDSQQTDALDDPHRPVNLWHAVEGDQGAHGDFDDRAHAFSPQLWLTTHRRLAAGVLAGAAVLGAAMIARAPATRRLHGAA